MKDEKKVQWWPLVVSAFISALFVALFSLVATWIMRSTLSVTISTPIQEEQYYITAIDIKNFSKKVESLDLCISPHNAVVGIESVIPYQQDNQNGIITIAKIQPQSSISLLLRTSGYIDKDNLRISGDSRTELSFLSEKKAISATVLLFAITQFAIYFSVMFIINFISQKKRNAQVSALNEELQTQKSEIVKLKKESVLNRKSLQWIKSFYLVRFSDYVRELSFWKDTIRKMIYSIGTKGQDVEKLFDVVTTSLRTFTTKEQKVDYQELEYIAKKMLEAGTSSKDEEE